MALSEPRDQPAGGAKARRTLLLIAAVVAAPVVLSYTFYYLFPRSASANYGELLPTVAITGADGVRPDGSPFRLPVPNGRWAIIMAAGGACDPSCSRALYATRQARTMQNKEIDRVERVWLVTDGVAPSPTLLAEHPDLVVVRAAQGAGPLPRGTQPLYLVDPTGHQVLAWPRDPDIKALSRDLSRLLRASKTASAG